MKYALQWGKSAMDDLAGIWVDADSPNRRPLTNATNEIDRVLQTNPLAAGESRGPGRRLLIQVPLAVLYTVDTVDRIVRVIHVWRFETPAD